MSSDDLQTRREYPGVFILNYNNLSTLKERNKENAVKYLIWYNDNDLSSYTFSNLFLSHFIISTFFVDYKSVALENGSTVLEFRRL